ncbi:MAG TPA: serine hydrolase domain-containing protein, partial [Flavisolibacter sp.]|nr:serine hydrolase domain-containing protein [Flavisolibacter sp.]
TYFSQIPNAGTITIEQLLEHRSGIHDISEDRDFRSKRREGTTKEELLALMVKSKPDFEPGAKYAYSNTGFQLLGLLVEKLTGTSYQQALQERIVVKSGLHGTYAATGNNDSSKAENLSYRFVTDWQPETQTHASLLFGSGAIISTSTDLAKFIHALFEGKLVSQKSLKQMLTIKDGYGLGMDTFTLAGKTFYGHTGGIDNFGAWLAYLPEEKLAVAYTTNAKVYPVSKIMDGVINIYYNQPFTIPSFESITISQYVLDKYVGVYSNAEAPVKFTVSRNDATLFLQMTGKSPIPLEPTAQEKFRIEPGGIVVEFDTTKKQMTIVRNGGARVLIKEN